LNYGIRNCFGEITILTKEKTGGLGVMTLRKNIVSRGFTANAVMILLFVTALMVNAQDDKALKDFEAKHPNGVTVGAKVLSIDPVKGDVSIRLEFAAYGDLIKEDGTLAKNIKFDTESSNGKTEVTFEKGKRMNATEVVINMYGDAVENYPFDKHNADLYLYFFTKPDKKKEVEKPKEEVAGEGDKPKEEAVEEEETEVEVPHFLMFEPTMSGYSITTAKSKESDDGYTSLQLTISRSPMVMLFSLFIMLLMWGVSLAVLALVFTVVILGRKSEIAMFSFITTLIFAFVTVRNSLPGVPPVGTFSDKLSFFWAEGILGMCLLAVVITWVFRKPA
jgi:Domain of unknown function (DUF4436)